MGNIEGLIDETKVSINRTAGNFQSEGESHNAFLSLATATGCFDVHEKKIGHIHYLPRWREPPEFYIPDFILLPSHRLIEAGWPPNDNIIVDAKKSGDKIGPGCSQLLDYLCASYLCGRRVVHPSWAFLWAARKQEKAIASVMAQQRFGTVIHGDLKDSGVPPGELHFYCGENLVLCIGESIRIGSLDIGKKSGSR